MKGNKVLAVMGVMACLIALLALSGTQVAYSAPLFGFTLTPTELTATPESPTPTEVTPTKIVTPPDQPGDTPTVPGGPLIPVTGRSPIGPGNLVLSAMIYLGVALAGLGMVFFGLARRK